MSGSLPHVADPARPSVDAAAPAISVCHIASGDLWAGAEVQIATLMEALAADRSVKLSAILLNEGRLAAELRRVGIDLLVLSEEKQGFFDLARSAGRWLAARQVQVLHSHRYKENILAALIQRRCRIPHLVRTQHGLEEPVGGYKAAKQWFVHGIDRWVGRRTADRVIAVSAEMREHLVRRYGDSRVVTLRNGIAVDQVRSALTAAQAKERLGLLASAEVVGFAGRLQPVKRLDLFLAAARNIASVRPQARFVIAGDGPQRAELQALVSQLGIRDLVTFLGHREDVYDVLRAMGIFLITSDHEGLPMVLLEAMCLGVPVVARKVGGLTEVLKDGCGELVDSSDPVSLAKACVGLLASTDKRQSVAGAANQKVRNQFSAQESAAHVAALYHSLGAIEVRIG